MYAIKVARVATFVTIKVAWLIVRWPVFAMLVILEPLVRITLAGLALTSLAMAIFFEIFAILSAFPFFGMLVFALASVALLMAYYMLLGMFAD